MSLAGAVGLDFLAVGINAVFLAGGGNAKSFGGLITMSLALAAAAGNATAAGAGNAFGVVLSRGNGRNE